MTDLGVPVVLVLMLVLPFPRLLLRILLDSEASEIEMLVAPDFCSLMKYFCAWVRICTCERDLTCSAMAFQLRPWSLRPCKKSWCSLSLQRPVLSADAAELVVVEDWPEELVELDAEDGEGFDPDVSVFASSEWDDVEIDEGSVGDDMEEVKWLEVVLTDPSEDVTVDKGEDEVREEGVDVAEATDERDMDETEALCSEGPCPLSLLPPSVPTS